MPFPFPRQRNPSSYPTRRRYTPRRVGVAGAIAVLIAAIAGGINQCSGAPPQAQRSAPSAQQGQTQAQRAPARTSAEPSRPNAYATADGGAIDDPVEVREIALTIADIEDGTPDRFRADREIYENHGSRLPDHPRGFWRAFTVITPSERDRGPRRLVVGRDGQVWFTRDHYKTFVRLQLTVRTAW